MTRLRVELLLLLLRCIICEVTVLKTDLIIYERTQSLKITGNGFDPIQNIVLELDVSGQALIGDVDYFISSAEMSGITLTLKENKR